MDADYYLDTIRVVFQEFSLVNGTWDVRDPTASWNACGRGHPHHRPLTIEGELDDISGAGQTEAAHASATASRRTARSTSR
jgi:poly(3-hydroxybutyrate) depolymerase